MNKLPGQPAELRLPMLDALPKKELILFGEVQTLSIRSKESEGDKICEWYNEKKLRADDPSKQTIAMHFSNFEVVLQKAQNLLRLFEKVLAEDYNSLFAKPKKESERKQDLVRMKTMLGDTLLLWYQRLFQMLKQSKDGLADCLLLSKMLDQIAKLSGKDLTALQDDNFREYLRQHRALLVAELSTEAQTAKQDMNGNIYNDAVYRNLGLLL